jgi:hypothetical protein
MEGYTYYKHEGRRPTFSMPMPRPVHGYTRVWFHAVAGDPWEEVEYIGPSPGYSEASQQVDIRSVAHGHISRVNMKSLYLTRTWS